MNESSRKKYIKSLIKQSLTLTFENSSYLPKEVIEGIKEVNKEIQRRERKLKFKYFLKKYFYLNI